MSESVSIAILAGGQSSRMGTDKSFVDLLGKPLIAHVIERVRGLALPVTIITNNPAAYEAFGLPVFTDVSPVRSSLMGLYSAIYHSPTDYTLCVACDMPFLITELLAYLISLRGNDDAVVPRLDGHPQGLHALYRKTCLVTMQERLEHNQLKIRELYGLVKTRWVDEDALRRFDSQLHSFVNVNTPEALEKAQSGVVVNE